MPSQYRSPEQLTVYTVITKNSLICLMIYIFEQRTQHLLVRNNAPPQIRRLSPKVVTYMNQCKNLHCYNEFIISANTLWANFNVINNLSMFLCMLHWCSVTAWRWSRQIATCRSSDGFFVTSLPLLPCYVSSSKRIAVWFLLQLYASPRSIHFLYNQP